MIAALDCVLVVTFLKRFVPLGSESFNHLHRCSQLRRSLLCSLSLALLGFWFLPQGHADSLEVVFCVKGFKMETLSSNNFHHF